VLPPCVGWRSKPSIKKVTQGGTLNEPVIIRNMMKESGAHKKWRDWRNTGSE
jgi:hypothetical protein